MSLLKLSAHMKYKQKLSLFQLAECWHWLFYFRVVNTAIIAITIAMLFSTATGIAILVACLVLHVVLQYF